ncbi:MAG: ABC transporter permease [Acidobacteriaceae bacterium]
MAGGVMRRGWERVRAFFGKGALDRELDAEMASHLEMAVEENVRSGMSAEEARRRALVRFGGMQRAREEQRAARGLPALDVLGQDLRYTVRTLRRDAGFTVVAVLILALGIGANVAVFSVVNTLLLRPLPFPESQRLVWIAPPPQKCGLSCATYSADAYDEFVAGTKSYTGVTGYMAFSSPDNLRLVGHGEPVPATGIEVIPNFFQVLGVQPMLGRLFTAQESRAGAHQVALLEYEYWKRQFAGDAGIVGRDIDLNGQPVTVVGVLPESFDFGAIFAPGERVDVVTPEILDNERLWGNIVTLVGRLKPGITPGQAQAEANLVAPHLCWSVKYPHSCGSYVNKDGPSMEVQTLKSYVSGKLRSALIVLWLAVGMILLIACVNLSNLLLARAAARSKEFAMRSALGASRVRMVRQLLTESLMLSAGGAILGFGLAWGLVRWLAHLGSLALPLLSTLHIDRATVGWTILIAIAAALFFGLIPGLRMASGNLQEALKDSGHGASAGRRHESVRAGLVIAEVALSCVLLVGAGLLLRSFLKVLDIDLGFQPDHAASIRMDYDDSAPTEEAREVKRGVIFRQAIDRVTALPGVKAAGIVDYLPLGPNRAWGAPTPKGKIFPEGALPSPLVYVCTPGYVEAMGMRLRGRDFSWSDGPGSPRVVLINTAAARAYWPGEDAVGKVLMNGKQELHVIGVVDDVHASSVENERGWQIYYPVTQAGPNEAQLVIRSSVEPASLAGSVLHVLRQLNPNQPATEFLPLESIVQRADSPRRFFMLLVSGFAGLGLLLAALGIYGVIAYSVTRQTQEIGIRMALGASRGRVQRAVLGRTLVLVGVGLCVGSMVSLVAARGIASLLYGTQPTDWVTYVGMIAALLGVALVAGYLPARRASRVNPLVALRMN